MAFTKEKLLDLKDKITYYKNRIDQNNLDILVVKLQFNDLNDLIARLEAAERVCAAVSELFETISSVDVVRLDRLTEPLNEWSKEAGKE